MWGQAWVTPAKGKPQRLDMVGPNTIWKAVEAILAHFQNLGHSKDSLPLPENDISREGKVRFAWNLVRTFLSLLSFPRKPFLQQSQQAALSTSIRLSPSWGTQCS